MQKFDIHARICTEITGKLRNLIYKCYNDYTSFSLGTVGYKKIRIFTLIENGGKIGDLKFQRMIIINYIEWGILFK